MGRQQQTCKRCVARGQTWPGDPPKCAFPEGVFVSDNWNCATMNELRDIVYKLATWNEDQYTAAIPLDCGWFIVLGWYKNRGRTELCAVVDEDRIWPATLEDADRALMPAPKGSA